MALAMPLWSQSVSTLNDEAGLFEPQGIAIDPNNHYLITESARNRLLKVDPLTQAWMVFSGNGEPGHTDGPAAIARFNNPKGLATGRGGVVVADSGNHTLRLVARDGSVTTLAGVPGRTGSEDGPGATATFRFPSAVAMDPEGNILVADTKNSAIRIVDSAGRVSSIAGPDQGLFEPAAIAVSSSGDIFIADTRNHRIALLQGRSLITVAGGGSPFLSGSQDAAIGSEARFNQPRGILWVGGGAGLLVADSANHTLRAVTPNPFGALAGNFSVRTIAGLPEVPGLADGLGAAARFNHPVGLARDAAEGSVLIADSANGAIRRLRGAFLGTEEVEQIVVTPPAIEPSSGYFPAGQVITVRSAVPEVYYTIDGTEPTASSAKVEIVDGIGQIHWRESLRDLTSLRLKAFVYTNSSETVRGLPAAANEIGFLRNYRGGIGSTVVIPLVAVLRPNDQLQSLQFRAEIAPAPGNRGATGLISSQFRLLSITPNDFVPLVPPSKTPAIATPSVVAYTNTGNTRGLAVSFIGTNANLFVSNYAVVALLAVPVPTEAVEGDRFELKIVQPSATLDGKDREISLKAGAPALLDIENISYLVGDSVPSGWYNAGDFGDGDLSNRDVNSAFYAALGRRLPFTFSDAFDAMDVFPEDSDVAVGGDGEIRFLDWQRILRRSLRLPGNTSNWTRTWSSNGFRVSESVSLRGSPNTPAPVFQSAPVDETWIRQALLGAGMVSQAQPDEVASVPILARVAPGFRLSGLMFSVSVEASEDSPPLAQPLEFRLAEGMPPGTLARDGLAFLGYGWDLGAFTPALEGRIVLGHLDVPIPRSARAGHHYKVRFVRADGSPDLDTQYDLETRRGGIWVRVDAPTAPQEISDDWWRAYFGDGDASLPEADSDSDGDGVSNWAEYLSGTDPTNAASFLKLAVVLPSQLQGQGVTLHWPSLPGRRYAVEAASRLDGGVWEQLGPEILGDGETKSVNDAQPSAGHRFYRVRVLP
jgi:sugar lactone lactonase YvrE